MKAMKLREVKKGEMFTLKPIDEPSENQVYIKEEYNKELKKWDCYKWSDICAYRSFKADKIVYVGFTF